MHELFRHLDRLLRGESTTIEALRDGIRVSASALVAVVFMLGTTYGACMGLFAVTGAGSDNWMQIIASMVKLPLLFLFTLAITFPSLYVFNALVGSRLKLAELLRLLIGAMAVMMSVLASMGPIVAFFSLSTTSYAFMVLLNVVVCGASGVLGLAFLVQTLHRIGLAESTPVAPPPLPAPGGKVELAVEVTPGALDHVAVQHPRAKNVRNVFRVWLIVFGLVGAQMSWVLRPFIGSPTKPFTLFREREGNFFEGVVGKISDLLDKNRENRPRGPSRRR